MHHILTAVCRCDTFYLEPCTDIQFLCTAPLRLDIPYELYLITIIVNMSTCKL